jgi:hypothetical protein
METGLHSCAQIYTNVHKCAQMCTSAHKSCRLGQVTLDFSHEDPWESRHRSQ